MHPHHRFSLSLVVSLALWWPTLQATLAGRVDVLDSSFRWIAAFAVASLGVRLLGGLVSSYIPSTESAPAELTAGNGAAGDADGDDAATDGTVGERAGAAEAA